MPCADDPCFGPAMAIPGEDTGFGDLLRHD